ncbi:M28 family peptidase [Halovenus sp. WSH3]|uniref:Carboxypeptidase Q n=1 Tax=Halovenus carboxidivorans TaxID=2692199 RepID=A0A6B0T0A0_9EURY|nr:M28 family peptidase [Halovenus carboxidivorans]MXR51245.1 M28 family peptidase [Halovenus carboxidivorans]
MGRLPDSTVGTAQTDPISWETLTALVDCAPRMAGSAGERAAMDELAERFRALGARDVSVDSFEIAAWERGESTLSVPERSAEYDGDHQVIGLPGTPSGTVSGRVVDVGHGTPAEFDEQSVEGALVIVAGGTPESYDRWFHRREKYELAVERGADGFLFQSRRDGCLPPTGDIGDGDPPGEIPGVGISREVGRRLARYASDGTTEAELTVDCGTEPGTSGNVSARLGPDTDRELWLTAHHDAHDIADGALDNGCGCALVTEVARLLATVEDDLETAVRLTTFGAEEVGLLGSTRAAEEHALSEITAVLNLDGIGSTRNLAVDTHGFPAIAEAFEQAADSHDVPVEIRERVNTHSDHWPFAREGVPAAMAYSTGGSDRRGWGHTHGDTLDKLDSRDLRALAVPIAEAVLELASGERSTERVSPDTVLERAREEGYDV